MSERTPEQRRRMAFGRAGYSVLMLKDSSYVLRLPKPLSQRFPPDALFKAELHEEGILFRYTENPPEPGEIPIADMPDWMRRNLRPGHPGRIDPDE